MIAALALVVLASSLLFSQGCGGGGGSTSDESPAPGTDKINLSLAVNESDAGPVAVISAEGSNIYQCSLRLKFDPAIVKPVSVEKGDLFQGDNFFFAPTDKEGFVPVGATLRWKGQESRSSGTVATIRFERLTDGEPQFRILDDAAYLIVKDDAETRLPVVITGGGQ
jgi:hypothetical protein